MDELDINYFIDDGFPTALFEPDGLIDFQIAWKWQKDWQKNLLESSTGPQAVWLLQHLDCYTLGRGAKKSNILFDLKKSDFELYRINRGGEVTYHSPGQLVAYLVFDLRIYETDLNWYLRKLENVLIDVLKELGLDGERSKGLTGVWCNGYKVASIGIGCRRWVTQHGLALNINCDLSGFEAIIPCGLKDQRIGKLDSWIPGLQIIDVQPLMKKYLKKHFGLLWIRQKTYS